MGWLVGPYHKLLLRENPNGAFLAEIFRMNIYYIVNLSYPYELGTLLPLLGKQD